MKVYIFYNGLDYYVPDSGNWPEFVGENNARLFLACAASWARQGWEPVRLTTSPVYDNRGFAFGGVLRRDWARYPLVLWNTWHAWRDLAPCFVANIDVFNQSFYPPEKPWHRSTSLHVNGWTASVGYVTPDYCEKIIKIIEEVDSGVLKAPECEMFCDDVIVRALCPPPVHMPYCDFAFIKQGWQHAKLTQFPRSTILRSMKLIETI